MIEDPVQLSPMDGFGLVITSVCEVAALAQIGHDFTSCSMCLDTPYSQGSALAKSLDTLLSIVDLLQCCGLQALWNSEMTAV